MDAVAQANIQVANAVLLTEFRIEKMQRACQNVSVRSFCASLIAMVMVSCGNPGTPPSTQSAAGTGPAGGAGAPGQGTTTKQCSGPPCTDDYDCGIGVRQCVDGRCLNIPCNDDAECAAGGTFRRCANPGTAESHCVSCFQSSDCSGNPPGYQTCVGTSCGCGSDADCPPFGPYHCGSQGYCGCATDADCTSPGFSRCDSNTARCQQCRDDADCAGRPLTRCLEGYCVCSNGQECEADGTGSECNDGVCNCFDSAECTVEGRRECRER